MKKLGLAALFLLPFLGGCVAYVPRPYYHARYYRPVYVRPAPVVVAPPPRVYW